MIGSTAGSHLASASSSCPAIQSGSLQCCQKLPLELQFHLWESEKVTGGEVQRVGRAWDGCRLRKSQKLPHECHASHSVVMMQGPGVVTPLAWTFTPDVSLNPLRMSQYNFSFHRLSWWNKFLMHDAFSVKLSLHFQSWFQLKVVKNALHH